MRIGTHSSRKATSVSQMALPRLAGEPGRASLSRLRATTKRARSRMSLLDQQCEAKEDAREHGDKGCKEADERGDDVADAVREEGEQQGDEGEGGCAAPSERATRNVRRTLA